MTKPIKNKVCKLHHGIVEWGVEQVAGEEVWEEARENVRQVVQALVRREVWRKVQEEVEYSVWSKIRWETHRRTQEQLQR